MTALRDPLAGQREAINNYERDTLVWEVAAKTDPCPVKVGDVFNLRDCSIEITRTERNFRAGEYRWIALFTRYAKRVDRPHLLDAVGGTTSDPRSAMGLGEDVFHDPPPNLDVIEEEDRSAEHKNTGEPLEPEAVPHHVVKGTRGSQEAHQRFQLELGAERVAEQEAPLEVRLARLRAKSRGGHVDISNELRVIEQRIEKAERKVERAA